jgi:hypothetical protein
MRKRSASAWRRRQPQTIAGPKNNVPDHQQRQVIKRRRAVAFLRADQLAEKILAQ